MTDGTTITIPKRSSLTLSFATNPLSIAGGETKSVSYTIKGAGSTSMVYAQASDPSWKVSVSKTNASTGTLTVTAPYPFTSSQVVIFATSSGMTVMEELQITEKKVSTTYLSLNRTSLSMTVGSTATLTATLTPSNSSDAISWSTSSSSIATVSSDGVVTAKAIGSCKITATSGSKTATCTVTVTSATPVTSITLDRTSLDLMVGGSVQLKATITPTGATNGAISWSSSNPSVLDVTSAGLVSAKSEGTAIITASAGGYTATCSINAYIANDNEDLIVNYSSNTAAYAQIIVYQNSFVSETYIDGVLQPNNPQSVSFLGDHTVRFRLVNKTIIGKDMFRQASCIKSVIIPDSVTLIGEGAFKNCTNLEQITFGKSVKTIGADAFDNNTKLQSIILPDSVTAIGDHAFSGCLKLGHIALGNGLISIGKNAFSACNSLESIHFPASLSDITENPFQDCISLKKLTIDDSCTTFDCREDCNALIHSSTNELIIGTNTSTIPSTICSIGINAFYGLGVSDILIPSSVKRIGSAAFYNCKSLKSVMVEGEIDEMGSQVFASCNSLSSVQLKPGIKTMGQNIFQGCSVLTSIVIPDTVTSIGRSAFSGCTGLSEVSIGSGIQTIGLYAFSGCSLLTSFRIKEGNLLASDLDISSGSYTSTTMTELISSLPDWSNGSKTYSLTLGSSNLSRLTAEQKAIATNKNWAVY